MYKKDFRIGRMMGEKNEWQISINSLQKDIYMNVVETTKDNSHTYFYRTEIGQKLSTFILLPFGMK